VTSREASARRVDLDVVRGVALIGVCLMNYHGYLVLRGSPMGDDLVHRIFDPFDGPLSTRFACTFVVVAGISSSLLVARVRRDGDDIDRMRARLVLVSRGVVLFVLGFALEHIWTGTIMWFYGLYFVVGAFVVFARRGVIVALMGIVMVATVVLQILRVERGFWPQEHGPLSWVGGVQWSILDGTHPLLPWLVFYFVGIILGRAWPVDRRRLATVGATLAAVALAVHWVVPSGPLADVFVGLSPWSRSPVYVAETLGIALVAIALIGAVAERHPTTVPTVALAACGRTTLTLYVGHVFVFKLLVDWLEWVRPTGLDVAMAMAVGYWLVGIGVAVVLQAQFGIGPLEWLYRTITPSMPRPAPRAPVATSTLS
jgi:uncharacterized membrane protein YeiB